MKESFYDFKAKDILGNEVSMNDFKDKVVLIVNVASACYFTPQYKGMEKLYKSFKNKGFEVLGFPCNQFAEEEKGTNEEILNFCTSHFDVSFPMFEKIEVKPEKGKLVIFSNSQHLHYVSKVEEAERFVLSFWYSRP